MMERLAARDPNVAEIARRKPQSLRMYDSLWGLLFCSIRMKSGYWQKFLRNVVDGEFSSILAAQLGFLPSLDHFIRPIQHGLRDRQTDLLSCLEVDH
jgi:hypothetical protein